MLLCIVTTHTTTTVAQCRVREGGQHQPVVYVAVATVTAVPLLLLLLTVQVCLILLHTSMREPQDCSKLLMLNCDVSVD
jgi:hypothetical protein